MAAPPAVGALGQLSRFDRRAYLRYMNENGRGYRNQAMELISICRLLRLLPLTAEKVFSQDAALSR